MSGRTVGTFGAPLSPPGVDPTSIVDSTRHLDQTLAPSTVVVYSRWWQRWGDWCAVNGFVPLPATSDTLERFVAELAFDGTSAPVIRQAIGAVRAAHRAAGFRDGPPRSASRRDPVLRPDSMWQRWEGSPGIGGPGRQR